MSSSAVLSKVLWMAFYRAHVLPIGLAAFFFMGLVKPPYLLFTGLFIRSLVLNEVAAFGVMMICLAWAGYASVYVIASLSRPRLEFLVNMGAMSNARLFLNSLWNISMAGLPSWVYILLMGYHAMTLHLPFGWVLCVVPVVSLGGFSIWLHLALARAKGSGFRLFKLPRPRLNYGWLLFLISIRSNRVIWFLVKGVSLLFVALMVQAGPEMVLPQIVSLAFVVSGLLHAATVYQLRREEVARLQWLKSMPIPVWQRASYHILLQSVIVLPEVGLLVLAYYLGHVPLEWATSCMLALVATQVLGLGLTHLPSMTGQDFLRLMFGVFVLSFLGLIFSVPLGALHAAMLFVGIVLTIFWAYKVDETLE